MNLFLELRRLGKLAKERHPMYERGRYAKMWIGLAAAFWIGYLVFIGIMFAFAFDGGSREPYHILNGGLVFISALDFILRFSFQRTPTQEMKPYLLLPIRRKRLIDFLLVRSGLSGFNFVWLFLFVPFAILTVTRFYGAGGVLAYCVGIWLLTLVNNYWYLLCRTLMGERIWWVLLPVLVDGGVAAALFLPDDSPLFELSAGLGDELMKGSPLAFAGVLLVIALMWLLDRRVIWHLMYNEMNKTEDSTVRVKTLSEYKFLDRYGDVGEYVRLELKLMLRNKMCRKALFSIACVVVMFSAIIAFTDIYGEAGNNFWILYNYGICGLLFLNTLMSYEGNYMDGLMSRRESIYSLLCAKYRLYAVALVVPFLLLLPAVIRGNIGLLQSLSWLLFTAGPMYFCFFQIAVYNNRTIPLNAKMTGRQDVGTSLQNLMGVAVFVLPFAVYLPLYAWLGDTAARWVLVALGLGFILTSKLWIRNVYRRFMQRRYKNMEGFRDSRQR